MLTPDRILREFEYRSNRLVTMGLFLLVSVSPFFFYYMAFYFDAEAEVLRDENETIQFRFLAKVLLAISPIGIVCIGSLFYSSFLPRRVALTANSVILPKPTILSSSMKEIEVPFDEIVSTAVVPFVGKEVTLKIMRESKPLFIFSNMFPKRPIFDELVTELSAALANHKVGREVPHERNEE